MQKVGRDGCGVRWSEPIDQEGQEELELEPKMRQESREEGRQCSKRKSKYRWVVRPHKL